LLEVRGEEQIAHAKLIMRDAGRKVCNGLEIGVDVDQKLEHGARYRDKRQVAKDMWATIMSALRNVGIEKVPAWITSFETVDALQLWPKTLASPERKSAILW
jgi:hypothetical protein